MSLDIRFCRLDEVSKLQAFIREEWSADHIFVYSNALLEYQHRSRTDNSYNFAVAVDGQGKFNAILGFIPPGHFGDAADDALWLSLWKTGKNCTDKGAGLALLKFLEKNISHDAIITAGISAQAKLIYKALRFQVQTLQHHYLAINVRSSGLSEGLRSRENFATDNQVPLMPGAMDHLMVGGAADSIGYRCRSAEYFVQKYERHPLYDYQVMHAPACDITLVFRVAEVQGLGRAMRIIDCGGNIKEFSRLSEAIEATARRAEVEYVDLLAHWPSSDAVAKAGFHAVQDEVLPNYFEPFVKKNVAIEFAVKNRNALDTWVFKGDGDQDRPSRIKGINA